MSRPSRNFSATFFVRKNFCVGNSAISTKRRALAVQGEREHAARRWMKARLEKPSHSLESLHRPKRRLHIAGGRVQAPPNVNRKSPKIMLPTFSDCRPLHQHRGQGDLSTRAEIAHRMQGCSPQSSSSSSQAILVFLHASEFFSPRHPDRQLRFHAAWIQVLRVLPFRGFLKPWGVRFSGVVGHIILKARAAPDRVRSIAKCGSERWEKTVQILAWRRASQG